MRIAHDARMRRIDVQDELKEGFEVSPVPAVGADGAPSLAPLRSVTPPHPRLCGAGPCRNYHRFEVQLDAAAPRAQTVAVALPEGISGAQPVPGGTVYQAPAAFHVETHHYCYPTVGVEMALGALPVIQCNRWDPLTYTSSGEPEDRGLWGNRNAFWSSRAGTEHRAQVSAWQRAREAEVAEAREADELIAESLRINPPPTPTSKGDR